MSNRLYKAVHVRDENEPEYEEWELELLGACEPRDPEGWPEFCEAKWGEYKPFFFPSVERIYKSRSAAQRRVDMINYWGGNAIVMECTPEWVPVDVASKQRADARVKARIEKKLAELAALEAQLE